MNRVNGCKIVFRKCDVSIKQDIDSLISWCFENFQRIDLFAANAGIITRKPNGIESFDSETFKQVFAINTMHPIYAAAKLSEYWLDKDDTFAFVVTASSAGLLTDMARLSYTLSKAAAVSFCDFMSINYRHRGILTVCVCPQAIKSKMTENVENSAAALDGIGEPCDLANELIRCLENEKFLVFLNDKIKLYVERKSKDRDRWLKGMRKLRAKI